MCDWYALCDNAPVGVVDHPILGKVPTCQRCVDKHDMLLLRFPDQCSGNVYVAHGAWRACTDKHGLGSRYCKLHRDEPHQS